MTDRQPTTPYGDIRVVLVNDPRLSDPQHYNSASQCDCDCDCACTLYPFPRLAWPLAYYLELTSDCNNQCPGCGNVFTRTKSPRLTQPPGNHTALNAVGWRTVLEQIGGHAQRLKLTGGEPTLHSEFEAIVHHIAAKHIPFTLFTNGRWPDPDRLVHTLRDLPECSGLLVSLHGATAPAHDAFTGVPGSFAETCANITRAVEAGLTIATSTVLTRHNTRQPEEIVTVSKTLGARQAVFNRYIGAPVKTITPTAEDVCQALRVINTLRGAGENVKLGSCIPACLANNSSTGCGAGTTFLTVDPWGNVKPCNHAPVVLGNLRHQTIAEIWHGPGLDKWDALVPQVCQTCSQFSQCHGGCRADALLNHRVSDSLMQAPLAQTCTHVEPETLQLYSGARPTPNYKKHLESFGWLLSHEGRAMILDAEHQPMLKALEGHHTLKQIGEQFGDTGLAFVGALYKQHLITLNLT